MKRNLMIRTAAFLLLAVMLCTLVGCSAARTMRASSNARKVVATAGDIEILYDELYYLTNTRIAELKEVYGEDVLDSDEARAELVEFVWSNLLTREHALRAVGAEYDIYVNKGEVGQSVNERMEEVLETNFEGDRDAYADSLNASDLTDRYVRNFLATNGYMASEIVMAMLQAGEIPDTDAYALEVMQGDDFIRTVQVFISRDNGRDDATNKANAEKIAAKLQAITDDAERYTAMRQEIGGAYNNDYTDTLGNGYYFAKGEMERSYESVALALSDYEASDVLETMDGYYIIMRLPKDEAYIKENFAELKSKSYYVALNEKVDAMLATMTLQKTELGETLDLFDLPEIDAKGGEGLVVVLVVALCVLGAGVVIFLLRVLLLRRRMASKEKQ